MKTGLLILFICFSQAVFAQSKTKSDKCEFIVPSNITRNDHDKLIISSVCDFFEFSFVLYSRWGTIIFKTNSFSGLDDFNLSEKIIVNGKEVDKYAKNETYVWIIHYKVKEEDESQSTTGNLMVL